MKKIGKLHELVISVLITIMVNFCGWIILPTMYSFKKNDEINNLILRFLVNNYSQNEVVYIIIAEIIVLIISYIIYKVTFKIVSD